MPERADWTRGLRVLPDDAHTVIQVTERSNDGDVLHTEYYVRVPDGTRGAVDGLNWRNLNDGELYSGEVIQATDTWTVVSMDLALTSAWMTERAIPVQVEGMLHYAIPAWVLAPEGARV